MELNQIYAPIQEDLTKVKEKLSAISEVDFPWLSDQWGYLVKGSGKGMRPVLTLLAGKFYRYNLDYLLPMAVSVELMHTSTLVHDDTIDNATVRRGQPTINSIWGDDVAILLGDYLFAKAGEFVADTQSPRAIKLFSRTLATISSGEISQFFAAFKLQQTREDYFRRISGKTASLFSLATEAGAILSEAPDESAAVLREYGYNLGIAFQIVDDILDFTSTEEELGKPSGSDLTQGTLTLPAMLALERYPDSNPVQRFFETKDKQYLAPAIELVRQEDIVAECYRIAAEYCQRACLNLKMLPENPVRQVLVELADFVIRRRE